jgi:hypothetical protein
MDDIETLDIRGWEEPVEPDQQARAVRALEHGRVVFLPELAFRLEAEEQRFLSPEWPSGSAKNISYDPHTARVRGTRATGVDEGALRDMMARYARLARRLVDALVPAYRGHLTEGRASFRPVQVVGRRSSWRKDDQRLHTDAYPSRPTRGARILRVFSNVNPDGEARVWRVGEPFDAVARAFLPALRRPPVVVSAALAALGITRGRRAPYDDLMLQLHDSVKRDLDYQARAPHAVLRFPPGSTWVVYTDQVLHAVMSGQHALEQTFYLPVSAQQWPETAPLSVLERLTGRALVDPRG